MHLIPEVRERLEPEIGAQGVQTREALLVPDPRREPTDDAVAQPSRGALGRLESHAERRHALGGKQVDVRHQDHERDAGGFRGDHRTERELRAQHDVGAVLGDGLLDVRHVRGRPAP